MIPRVLTIAGSDSGGGAGIQADLKTFTAFGTFGMCAVTAVTAQNTLGVQEVYELPPELIGSQIDSVCNDLGVDAAKTGMLASSAIVRVVAAKVREHQISPLVVDPVMVAKGGTPILADEAVDALLAELVPLATVLTPNRYEAERLTGLTLRTREDFLKAARMLVGAGAQWVVVKGGHGDDERQCVDVATDGNSVLELAGPRFVTEHTHGTGCTFASAVAALLAGGTSIPEALRLAREYVGAAIAGAPGLGGGHGPINHLAGVSSVWAERQKRKG